MIGALPFGSCYVYSPRGRNSASCCSRRLRARLKALDEPWIEKYVARVRHQVVEQGLFSGLFDSRAMLVPVPRSAPMRNVEVWVARRLALALQQAGLGAGVWMGLQRRYAIRKSATAPDGERPSVAQQFESLTLGTSLAAVDRVLLVDDVVTKGRTLLAAALRVREVFPTAEVRAFALVRTMGLVKDVAQLVEPCEGEIRWHAGDALRAP